MKLRRRIGLVVAVLVPVVIVAVALQGFVREVLIGPVLYVYWIVRLFLESIPQIWVWLAFLLLATYLVTRGVVRRTSLPRARRSETVERGRIEEWAHLLHQARHDPFTRWRLAQRLGGLVGDVLAAEERVSQREIWRRLDRSHLDVPQPLRAYLTAQLRSIPPSGLRSLRTHASPLDLDPAEVVQYLEDRLRRE
jgi:hypothetical protein